MAPRTSIQAVAKPAARSENSRHVIHFVMRRPDAARLSDSFAKMRFFDEGRNCKRRSGRNRGRNGKRPHDAGAVLDSAAGLLLQGDLCNAAARSRQGRQARGFEVGAWPMFSWPLPSIWILSATMAK